MQQGLGQGRRKGVLAAMAFGLERKLGVEKAPLLAKICQRDGRSVSRAFQQALKAATSLPPAHSALRSCLA